LCWCRNLHVVVGILIAFGLDSWWDSTKQVEWEHGQLGLLRDEAQSNFKHIKSAIEAHERSAADVQVILDFATQQPFGELANLKNSVVSSLIMEVHGARCPGKGKSRP
jgi:hypothetical protein